LHRGALRAPTPGFPLFAVMRCDFLGGFFNHLWARETLLPQHRAALRGSPLSELRPSTAAAARDRWRFPRGRPGFAGEAEGWTRCQVPRTGPQRPFLTSPLAGGVRGRARPWGEASPGAFGLPLGPREPAGSPSPSWWGGHGPLGCV